MTAALRVEHATVRYGDVVALDDASVTLEAGRVCGLVGMNGSGKSSLFRAIMGRVPIGAGRVEILGREPEAARREGLVGYVPQHEDVDRTFPVSVREVVATGRYGRLGPTRRLRDPDRAAVDDALDRVGLADLAARPIGALSGGQRKRAFVARGLAQEARLLLLDEPFAGVDTTSAAVVTRLLRELADDGATVLVATHDLDELPALADEAVLLRGRPLLHDRCDVALRPAHLARAFGLDPLAGREAS